MPQQNNTLVSSSSNATLASTPAAPVPPTHSPANEPESSLAAQRVAADMALVTDADTETINIDPVRLVSLVLASTTRLAAYQPAFATLPGIDASRIAKLRDYTLALAFWQGRTQSSVTQPPELSAMVASAVDVRDRTLADLRALVNHGLLASSQLENFMGSPAHRKLGLDLISISGLVHAEWPRIGGKTLITLESMDEAARLGERILQAAGDRDAASTVETSQAQKQRDKAYTLVMRTYDQARRAIAFLRYDEDDADVVLPSLFAGRGGRKRASDATKVAPANIPSAAALMTADALPATAP